MQRVAKGRPQEDPLHHEQRAETTAIRGVFVMLCASLLRSVTCIVPRENEASSVYDKMKENIMEELKHSLDLNS